MREGFGVSAVLIALLSATAWAGTCPETQLDETARDCPWAGLARDMTLPGAPSLESVLAVSAPAVLAELSQDKTATAFLGAWGNSLNFDQIAKGLIVDPAILSGLYGLAGVTRPTDPDPAIDAWTGIQHAGIEHTYGYLFSLLQTPFGYKRARWVGGEMEAGFLFGVPTFSPYTKDGSLFANVTYFAGRIGFRRDPKELAELDVDRAHVAASVLNFEYGLLNPKRLEEVVTLADGTEVTLRTDFVPFLAKPVDPTNSDSQLLIYSVVRTGDRARLITAFPVSGKTVQTTIAPGMLGSGQAITTQYNGYVRGLTGATITGLRRLN